MNANQVLVKTSKGRDEIKTRSLNLSQHERNLLIATDGQKTCGTLSQLYSKIPDVNALLQDLLDKGLIEPLGGSGSDTKSATHHQGLNGSDPSQLKLRQATQYLNDTINSNVGFGGFTLTLKASRCNTLDDIRALVPEYQSAINKKRGPDTAEALTAKLLEIIK